MRNVWIASVIALVVVGALALYASSLLDDMKQRDERLKTAYGERAEGLRKLDQRYPYTPRPTLDPARMEVYLEARNSVGAFFRERLDETSGDNVFHSRQTRNEVLLLLTGELNARKMSLKEYRAISERWQAILARGERLGLLGEWRRVVTTKEHPDGLPLPEAARDATPEELELMRKHDAALKEGLHADLLGPVLKLVAEGGP